MEEVFPNVATLLINSSILKFAEILKYLTLHIRKNYKFYGKTSFDKNTIFHKIKYSTSSWPGFKFTDMFMIQNMPKSQFSAPKTITANTIFNFKEIDVGSSIE